MDLDVSVRSLVSMDCSRRYWWVFTRAVDSLLEFFLDLDAA